MKKSMIFILWIGLYLLPNYAQTEIKLLDDSGAPGDKFGISVSISGNHALVGAPFHDYESEEGLLSDYGKFIFYELKDGTWQEQYPAQHEMQQENLILGYDVDLDSNYAIITAPWHNLGLAEKTGMAVIYCLRDGIWGPHTYIVPDDVAEDDRFGISAAISGDYAIVGSFFDDDLGDRSGSAYIFKREGDNWSQQQKLVPDDGAAGDWFGVEVDIHGDYATVGSRYNDNEGGTNAGAVYVYKREEEVWVLIDKLIPEEGSGSVSFEKSAISDQNVLVGSPNSETIRSKTGNAFIGKICDNSISTLCSVFPEYPDGFYDNDKYGHGIGLTDSKLVIGSPNFLEKGGIYVYKYDKLDEELKITASDSQIGDKFGADVDIDGNHIIVGAYSVDENGEDAGAVYIYSLPQESTISIDQYKTEWLNPSPANNTLLSLSFVNENIGYASGENGTIIKTADGSNSWITQSTGTLQNLNSIYALDEYKTIAVGENGIILKTNDGGENWDELKRMTYNTLNDISFADENTGFIVGNNGTLLRSDNGGKKWYNFESGAADNLYSVFFVDENTGFISCGNDYLLKTTDGGDNWIRKELGVSTIINSIYFINEDIGYAVGIDGIILKTIDGGNNWISQESGVSSGLKSVFFVNENTGFIAGYFGRILKTTDGGNTWTLKRESDEIQHLYSIKCINEHKIIAVGIDVVAMTEDSGETWINKQSEITDLLASVFFTNNSVGYAVGFDGFVLKTSDKGENWENQSFVSAEHLYAIYFVNEDKGFIVGENGTITKTEDAGESWSEITLGLINQWHDIYFINDRTGFIVGTGGVILKTTDGGDSWSVKGSGTRNGLNNVWFYNENIGYIVGSNVVLKTIDGGETWAIYELEFDEVLFSVFFINENTGFATGQYGTLLRTTDGGNTWQKASIGTNRPKTSIHFLDERTGYILNVRGLYVTKDGGDTWSQYLISDKDIFYDFFFTDDNTCYIVGINSVILKITGLVDIPLDDPDDEPVALSVAKDTDIEKLFVYPNPARDYININLSTLQSGNKNVQIVIYNIRGQLLSQQLLRDNQKIDISHLNPGTYFVQITNNNQIISNSVFIKQ